MQIRYEYAVILTIVWTILVISLIAFSSFAVAASNEPDVYDLWNDISQFEEVSSLRKLLLNKNWISEDVSIDELDYILVLTQQCSNVFFPSVPSSLVLSVISVESGFKSDLIGFNNDTGLMQIIPNYHMDRIEEYLYDENIWLDDPRLNIMVGMSYLEELLDWSKGDLMLAVMAYNMGQVRARHYYETNRRTYYCEKVLRRMDEIQSFFDMRSTSPLD